jgi:branched-chain amino acid transport system ATP-binding protein
LPEASTCLLDVKNLVAGYGKREVIKGVSVNVGLAEIVALIGHNGAGKTTLLKAIFGLIPIRGGEVILDAGTLRSPNPQKLLALGVAYVPQGNRVFTELTVRENLELGGVTLPNKARLNEGINRALDLFPALKPKLRQRAGALSGGEKQMLALSNALVLSPRLLLLDEPSLGLAPQLVSQTLQRINEISTASKTAVLIVEQKVREVLKIADCVYVLRNGRVSFSGPAEDLHDETKLRGAYL